MRDRLLHRLLVSAGVLSSILVATLAITLFSATTVSANEHKAEICHVRGPIDPGNRLLRA